MMMNDIFHHLNTDYTCSECVETRIENLKDMAETQKSEYKKFKEKCGCGKMVRRGYIKTHCKSKLHKKWEEEKREEEDKEDKRIHKKNKKN